MSGKKEKLKRKALKARPPLIPWRMGNAATTGVIHEVGHLVMKELLGLGVPFIEVHDDGGGLTGGTGGHQLLDAEDLALFSLIQVAGLVAEEMRIRETVPDANQNPARLSAWNGFSGADHLRCQPGTQEIAVESVTTADGHKQDAWLLQMALGRLAVEYCGLPRDSSLAYPPSLEIVNVLVPVVAIALDSCRVTIARIETALLREKRLDANQLQALMSGSDFAAERLKWERERHTIAKSLLENLAKSIADNTVRIPGSADGSSGELTSAPGLAQVSREETPMANDKEI